MTEGRLDELTLRLPEGAFAGQETVAKKGANGGVVAGFQEISGILDEDEFDRVGMRNHHNRDIKEMIEDDVTKFPSALCGIAAPMTDKLVSIAEGKYSLGTGREGKRRKRGSCCGGHRIEFSGFAKKYREHGSDVFDESWEGR